MGTTARKLHWRKPDSPDSMCGRNGALCDFTTEAADITCKTCLRRYTDAEVSIVRNKPGIFESPKTIIASAPVTIVKRGPRARKATVTRAERRALGTRKGRRAYTKNPAFRDRPDNIWNKTRVKVGSK